MTITLRTLGSVHYADDGSPYIPLPPNDHYDILQFVPDPLPPVWRLIGMTTAGVEKVVATGIQIDP